VFVKTELNGQTFRELAADTGIPLNTLLSRKRYAVIALRRWMRTLHDDYYY
jgi:DNA-directed RNA polymerase specialized sigma24 family protein